MRVNKTQKRLLFRLPAGTICEPRYVENVGGSPGASSQRPTCLSDHLLQVQLALPGLQQSQPRDIRASLGHLLSGLVLGSILLQVPPPSVLHPYRDSVFSFPLTMRPFPLGYVRVKSPDLLLRPGFFLFYFHCCL